VFSTFPRLVAALGVGVYLLFIFKLVVAMEERLGVLEPLPEDLGKCKSNEASPRREPRSSVVASGEQTLFSKRGAGSRPGRLLRQVPLSQRSVERRRRIRGNRITREA